MLKVEMLTDKKISEGDINEIAILMDNDGIDVLCEELQRLKSVPSPDHIHLGTEEWAGYGLDSTPAEPGYIRANQLELPRLKGKINAEKC